MRALWLVRDLSDPCCSVRDVGERSPTITEQSPGG